MRFHQLSVCQIKLTVMNILIASVLSPPFLSSVDPLLHCMLVHNENAFTYSVYLQNELISSTQCNDQPTVWLMVMFLKNTMYMVQLIASNCILKGCKTFSCKKLHINLHKFRYQLLQCDPLRKGSEKVNIHNVQF